MFNKDFYPTPNSVIETMISKINIDNKVVLEPSAGKGNIVNYIKPFAKEVLVYEIEPELRKILQGSCIILGSDFLQCKSEDVSHIQVIIMNPPFSSAERHICHAFDIAPAGCEIVALCDTPMFDSNFRTAQKLKNFISNSGYREDLGSVFAKGERTTNVPVSLIYLKKPGANYEQEFEGFFEDEEEKYTGGEGITSYNFIRDIVNRYVESVKIFDRVYNADKDLKEMSRPFYSKSILSFTDKDAKQAFRREAQKGAWKHILEKMNMQKFMTKGLIEQINKFVEQQVEKPFTMKNIFHMIDVVIQTHGQRIDKAIEEVFDKFTQHYHENRYSVEGWKTNSHYLIGKKFIVPGVGDYDNRWGTNNPKVKVKSSYGYENFVSKVNDLCRILAYITGGDYDFGLEDFIRYEYHLKDEDGRYIFDDFYKDLKILWGSDKLEYALEKQKKHVGSKIIHSTFYWGEWFEWGFFKVKVYKKGSAHFEFLDERVWALFNQNVARVKGFPLPESVAKKARDATKNEGNQQSNKVEKMLMLN